MKGLGLTLVRIKLAMAAVALVVASIIAVARGIGRLP